MHSADHTLRLTWIPAFPAPFESIWSIFAKVIVLNEMSLQELVKMIRRADSPISNADADCQTADWIDFERFSKLLQVDEDRLRQGTFASMKIVDERSPAGGVRLCPECWNKGYHCSLFDIDAIAACPLHRCPLSKACSSCLAKSMFISRSRAGDCDSRFCTRCDVKLPSRIQLIEWGVAADSFGEAMNLVCTEFVEWWRDVNVGLAHRDIVLSGLLSTGRDEVGRKDYRSWQLHRAQSAAQRVASSWQFKFQPEAVRQTLLIAKDPGTENLKADNDELRIRDEDARGYRSLRRHIYTSFVRSHHHCHKQLRFLTREESLSLDGDKICCIALAFLIWRMAIEGVLLVEGLCTPRANNFRIRLMEPRGHMTSSVEVRLQWSYFAFWGIVRNVRRLLGRRNIRVERDDTNDEVSFYWKAFHEEAGSAKRNEFSSTTRFSVLYPESAVLMEEARIECERRKKGGSDIFDTKWYEFIDRHVRMPNEDCDSRKDVLFQIRHPSRAAMSQSYAYIGV